MDSKETGLVIGLTVGQYLFDSDDLHYGFWPDDLEIRPEHIKQAQDHHSELTVSTIPKEVHTILDVGCGAGALAKRLLEPKYFSGQRTAQTFEVYKTYRLLLYRLSGSNEPRASTEKLRDGA